MLDAAVCWEPDLADRREGHQQATPHQATSPLRGVLRDYEQRGCDAEEIVQPPQKCGIGR
ncbi:MAG: hypothetical protein A3G20_07080 [Acidobacteria bacterium RIFCSPLOWO2_12_FULL_59_11]|nr:MAG: hypothetical protein A3G20_07080 [Acidobacteria bacterium RIFCSPLOWO2_12_FULL_59_11]